MFAVRSGKAVTLQVRDKAVTRRIRYLKAGRPPCATFWVRIGRVTFVPDRHDLESDFELRRELLDADPCNDDIPRCYKNARLTSIRVSNIFLQSCPGINICPIVMRFCLELLLQSCNPKYRFF